MGRPNKYTIKQVARALREAEGNFSKAAQFLGCTRDTVSRYVKLHPELQADGAQISEELIDLAESELVKKVRAGAWSAVKFVLETKGATRGWIVPLRTNAPGSDDSKAIVLLKDIGRADLEALISSTERKVVPDDVH